MKLAVAKINNAYEGMPGLFPMNTEAEEAFKKISSEELIKVLKCRNPKFHRKAFALFNLVLENQDTYSNLEDLLVEIKLKCGHYNEHITTKGVMIYVPKSINFEEMKELEFQAFMSKAIDVILEHFCHDMDRSILEEIVRF